MAEHYCTYSYRVKGKRHYRLIDTAQFNHKQIPNPTITHADKIMEALAECAKAIKGMGNISSGDYTKQLQQLTTQAVTKDARVAETLIHTLVTVIAESH